MKVTTLFLLMIGFAGCSALLPEKAREQVRRIQPDVKPDYSHSGPPAQNDTGVIRLRDLVHVGMTVELLYDRCGKPDTALEVGRAFSLKADIEAEGPVDSTRVRIQPRRTGADPLYIGLDVPEGLRSEDGNLAAKLDTTLAVETVLDDTVREYLLSVDVFVRNGRRGTSQGIPVHKREGEPE